MRNAAWVHRGNGTITGRKTNESARSRRIRFGQILEWKSRQ
jgi:hypothetical protein